VTGILGEYASKLDVVCLKGEYKGLFVGERKAVKAWIESNPSKHSEVVICVGKTLALVSVDDYLK
jgi:hypothetical protein